MYKISLAIIMSGALILYYNIKNDKNNIVLARNLIILMICNIIEMNTYNNYDVSNIMNIKFMVILIFSVQILKYNKYRKEDILLINMSYTFLIATLLMEIIYIKDVFIDITLIFSCILVSILSFRNFNKYNLNKIMSISVIVNVGLDICFDTYIINNAQILNLVLSTYVYYLIYRRCLYNIDVDVQDKKIKTDKLIKKIDKNEDKLLILNQINERIKSNLENKDNILNNILYDVSKCIFVIDERRNIIEKDAFFYKMWKKSKRDLAGIDLEDFLDKNIKDKEIFTKALDELKSKKYEVEIYVRGKKGRYFKIKLVRMNAVNRFLGSVCYVDDITYKVNTEKKIKQNQAIYKTIIENIPYDILVVRDGNIEYNNKQTLNLDEKSLNEIININQGYKEIEVLDKNKNKEYKDVNVVEFEEINKKVISIKDTTRYKNILEKLKIIEKKQKSLVDNIPEGIYTLDLKDNKISYANDNLLKMIVNTDLLIKKDNISTIGENNMVEFKREKVINSENDLIYIEHGRILLNIGERQKIIGIVRDVTQQVKIEEKEVETEIKIMQGKIKNKFIINASHELRTPLHVIASTTQLINKLLDDNHKIENKKDILKDVKNINENTSVMLNIVNNIIKLFEIESNIVQSVQHKYNIVTEIEEIVDKTKYDELDITFDTEEEEYIVEIDKEYLEEIIKNTLLVVMDSSNYKSNIDILLKRNKDGIEVTMINNGGYDYLNYQISKNRESTKIGMLVVEEILKLYNGKVEFKKVHKYIEAIIKIPVKNINQENEDLSQYNVYNI